MHRQRMIVLEWQNSVLFIILQLIAGILSEVKLTAALDCNRLTWSLQQNGCPCSVFLYHLLLYKGGLQFPWASVPLQTSAHSFQLDSLSIAPGNYQIQIEAVTSNGAISKSNLISYTTEGDCNSVAHSVLTFGVVAVSLGLCIGICLGISLLCQLKKKNTHLRLRESKRTHERGPGDDELPPDRQTRCETPCSSYIDVSDVSGPNQRESAETNIDVQVALRQDSTDYLDILPATKGNPTVCDRVTNTI